MLKKSVVFAMGFLCLFQLLRAQDVSQLILNKDYTKALEQVDLELSGRPTPALYFLKGIICEKMMNFSEAVSALETASEKDPERIVYLEELAGAYAAIGYYSDAVAVLKRALRIDPENTLIIEMIARNYLNLKDYKNAYSCYFQVWKKDSSNIYYKRYFAYTAYRTEKLDVAARLYGQLAAARSHDLTVYLNLAMIKNKLKDPEGAIQACQDGLSLFPGNPALLEKKAGILFYGKEYGPAQSAYEEYLALGDSVYGALKNYGICLYYNKQEDLALLMLGKCYAQNANDPILDFYIGGCYQKLKLFPESITFFKLTIETATPHYLADVYHLLGQVYGQERRFKESVEAYQEALKLDSTKVELLFEIASTYEEFNHSSTVAMNYYNAYLKLAGERAERADYALGRIEKLKEELFFEK